MCAVGYVHVRWISDPFYEGIVYALRPLYILAYVPQFGFSVLALKTEVRPDVGARLRFRLKEAEGFIIRLDIPYQAVAVEEVGNVTDEQLLEVQKVRAKSNPLKDRTQAIAKSDVCYSKFHTRVLHLSKNRNMLCALFNGKTLVLAR